ncbi:MAG: hypothetical protein ACHQJ6_06605 [Candidatus Berkiellales bacterium]
MFKAILISYPKSISFKLAQQLLRCGLVKIVKYFPLTLKWKGNSEEGDPEVIKTPFPNKPFIQAKAKRGSNEQAVVF